MITTTKTSYVYLSTRNLPGLLTRVCQEILRLRNFTLGKKLSDEEIIGPGGLNRIADLISCMVPFVSYGAFIVGSESAPPFGGRRCELAWRNLTGVSTLEGCPCQNACERRKGFPLLHVLAVFTDGL